MAERYFTLDEANELVPWLQSTFETLAPVHQKVVGLEGQLGELLHRSRTNGGASLESKIAEKRQTLESASVRLEQGLREITQKGIIVRDVERGLVDFPSMRDKRDVYLCWIMGEERIGFWHEADVGFTGRQPL